MENEKKIPSTLKEHIQSYFADIKIYLKTDKILRRNKAVFVCYKCNKIYPQKHSPICDDCDGYMHMHLSNEVQIKIPTRQEKCEHIRIENEKLKKQKEIEKWLEEKKENNLIYIKFYKLLESLDHNNTEEILEYLIKVRKLDNYYKEIPDSKKYLIDNFEELKNKKIENILNQKFDRIWQCEDKYSLYQSYLEELKCCVSRFPECKDILNVEIISIENCLEDLKKCNV